VPLVCRRRVRYSGSKIRNTETRRNRFRTAPDLAGIRPGVVVVSTIFQFTVLGATPQSERYRNHDEICSVYFA